MTGFDEGFEIVITGDVFAASTCKLLVLNWASNNFVSTVIFIFCAVRYKAFCSDVQYSNCPVYIKLHIKYTIIYNEQFFLVINIKVYVPYNRLNAFVRHVWRHSNDTIKVFIFFFLLLFKLHKIVCTCCNYKSMSLKKFWLVQYLLMNLEHNILIPALWYHL